MHPYHGPDRPDRCGHAGPERGHVVNGLGQGAGKGRGEEEVGRERDQWGRGDLDRGCCRQTGSSRWWQNGSGDLIHFVMTEKKKYIHRSDISHNLLIFFKSPKDIVG